MLEPIGKHIRLVDERNRRASNPPLLGVSIEKVFMPSVANTIGSNMANYKVVRKGQFACSLMQVRRDKKMPVALLRDYEEAIVSPAYPVFEIIDEDQLLPAYLMMWMLRPEFDREACFYAVGGVRGSLEWVDLCNMRLPVPSIEKQREIVKEYQTVVDRIRLNERLNEKLEEAAQAIYKQWFVEFEFPMTAEYAESIGKPELEGQPYKSSGGEMEYNEVLEQAIPKGWYVEKLGEILESHSRTHDFEQDELIFFNTSDIYDGSFLHKDYRRVGSMPGQAKKSIRRGDILFSEIRPKNKRYAVVRIDSDDYVVSTKLMVLRRLNGAHSILRLYHYLTSEAFIQQLQQAAEGRSGTFPQITFENDIERKPFVSGDDSTEGCWQTALDACLGQIFARKDEAQRLTAVAELLLERVATL